MPEVEEYSYPDRRSAVERKFHSFRIISAASVVCAATSMAAGILMVISKRNLPEDSVGSFDSLLVIIVTVSTMSSLMLVVQRILQNRRYRVRISLTGQPAAGKTVFSVLLYYIISFCAPKGVGFSAETGNVIEVFRALRGFDRGEWPKSTSTDGVSLMKGELVSRSQVSGQSSFEITIADTAGEYWADLDAAISSDHPYLTLIAGSDVIAHVIPVSELRRDVTIVKQDILDLRMASQLMSAKRGRVNRQVPLLVIFSKCDGENIESSVIKDHLFRVYRFGEISALGGIGVNVTDAVRLIEEGLSSHFSVSYLFSSALEMQEKNPSSDLVKWVMRVAAH